MEYKIIGDSLPAVVISLNAGETVQCESGSMSWMDNGIKMETKTGGLGKMFGRMISASLSLSIITQHSRPVRSLSLLLSPDRSLQFSSTAIQLCARRVLSLLCSVML